MKMFKFFSKKIIVQGLFVSALLCCFLNVALAESNVSIKGDNVNIRTGPSTSKPVYMELLKGYPLKVIKRQGDWLKVVDYENDSGWVHASLVEKGYTVIVNGKVKINMRSGPSRKTRKVADVYRGTVLTKILVKGDWVKVKHDDGAVGWIHKPLLWP